MPILQIRDSNKVCPIEFQLSGLASSQFLSNAKASHYKTVMKVNKEPTSDFIFIEKESVYYGDESP